jgi:hypothetical protein
MDKKAQTPTIHLVKEAPEAVPSPEPWVDLRRLAEHIGFEYQATRKMALEGKIPGKLIRNGKKTFWRFKLSAVDAHFAQSPENQKAG